MPAVVYSWEHGIDPKSYSRGLYPPVEPLVEWARLRGFTNPESAGWALSRSIFKRGTAQFAYGATDDVYTRS